MIGADDIDAYVHEGVKNLIQQLGPFKRDQNLHDSLGQVNQFEMRTLQDYSQYLGEWLEAESGEWMRQGYGV